MDRLITTPCSRRPAPAVLLNVAQPMVVLIAHGVQAGGRRAAAEGDRYADLKEMFSAE